MSFSDDMPPPELREGIMSPSKEVDEVDDNDRALSVLNEALCLFEDLQRGCSLSARRDHLEEVSKLTGVSPAIILYAYKHGTHRAHTLFLDKSFEKKKPSVPVKE